MHQLTPRQCVQQSIEALGVVGRELHQQLIKEIPAKVLLRRGRDVVLLSGPTGSGKERVAAVCHHAAKLYLGRTGDLVKANCANLRGELLESELFGHRRGSFTGAQRDFGGLVGQAAGGTLVLDEFQSLDAHGQARLLRFLGEREYRSLGDAHVQQSDALIILSTNRNLRHMVEAGEFRRDLFDRATATLRVPSLCERRQDIAELAQLFAAEAGKELEQSDFYGLTKRALSDVEAAVLQSKEVSVRRLRQIVRDAVFAAAAEGPLEALESAMMLPVLQREFGFAESKRDAQDISDLESEFPLAVGMAQLQELARRHHASPSAIKDLCRGVQAIIDEMNDRPRNYRNVVERTNRLAKVALWLVSGASTQADFRRFFGEKSSDMPTKSVAHQVYYEVFPKKGTSSADHVAKPPPPLVASHMDRSLPAWAGDEP